MDIGEVLSKAWHIIWKNKVLWIFGILAGCTAGNGSSPSYQFSRSDFGYRSQQFFNNIPDWQIWLGLALLIGLALVIIFVIILLSTIGRIGIIRGTMQADTGQTNLRFGELFNGSFPYFWRVFGLNLLIFLIIFVVILIFFGFFALAAAVTLGIALICLIPLLCLIIPIGWFVSIIIEQANAALVVDNIGVFEALSRGWNVVKDNLGETLIMGLILGIGGAIVGFLIGLPFIIIFLPVLTALFFNASRSLPVGIGVSLICLILYLPVLLALNGALRSYIGSAWALTYMRLTGRTALPAVVEPPEVPSV
jgi:hypothetical protein